MFVLFGILTQYPLLPNRFWETLWIGKEAKISTRSKQNPEYFKTEFKSSMRCFIYDIQDMKGGEIN